MEVPWPMKLWTSLALPGKHFVPQYPPDFSKFPSTIAPDKPNHLQGIPVAPQFQDAYDEHKNELGNPLGPDAPTDNAMYTVYEHGKVIWVSKLRNHYIIHDNPNHDWRALRERSGSVPHEWFVDEVLKLKFPATPKGKYPPLGKIAIEWLKKPNKWKTELGWRQWHCSTEPGIRFQVFEKGIIIGILPVKKGNPRDQSYQILTLIDGPRWSASAPVNGDTAPGCTIDWELRE